MTTRIGVDVGGTFTDLIFYDAESGEISVGKGPTTTESQDIGVGNVVSDVVPGETLPETGYFLHGTTAGINALLERRGARLGILTTRGFRDILEARRALRRAEIDATYDLLFKTPDALVPRHLRLPVTERIRFDGEIVTPLEKEDIRLALEEFGQADVDCIAVIFMNSHANPAHELAAAAALREFGFEGSLSLSHQISSEFQEYERASTTVVDAFIRPEVSRYLGKLDERLQGLGFAGDSLITTSSGSAIRFAEAARRPFETVMSGPVAGAVAAADLCQRHGIDLAIIGDVGGTSFDTALLLEGRPVVKFEGEVLGMPLQTPWVDVRSIGAGGGSIAFEEGGLLRVGPRSAGAQPGPVCYRRGGTEPTITDAAATLGMLGFGELAGGLSLDFEGAEKAVAELGRSLGLEPVETARGILDIANISMAQAIKSVSVELGEDVREAALILFGGAGPIFGCLLAKELGMSRVLIPNYAGNFSAWGLLSQDLARASVKTLVAMLGEDSFARAEKVAGELFAALREEWSQTPQGAVAPELEASLDLRFFGQEYTINMPMPTDDAGGFATGHDDLAATFKAGHEKKFGHALDGPIEIVAVRAMVKAALPELEPRAKERPAEPGTPRERRAFSFAKGAFVDFQVIARDDLVPGETIDGPAIVTEETATTYVDADFRIHTHEDGTIYLISREGQQ